MMKKNSIVDLSQKMYSGKEVNFNFELELRDAVESMSQLKYTDDVWYKIGYVNMCTHKFPGIISVKGRIWYRFRLDSLSVIS